MNAHAVRILRDKFIKRQPQLFAKVFGNEHRHFGVVVALMRDVFVDVEVQFFHKFFGAERVYEIIVILMNCLHVHEVVIY